MIVIYNRGYNKYPYDRIPKTQEVAMSIAKNITTTEYTGTTVLSPNSNRSYFYVISTVGTATVQFGYAGGQIPLANLAWYEPYVCTTGEITVVGTTYVIAEG